MSGIKILMQQSFEIFMLILLAPLNSKIPHICGFSQNLQKPPSINSKHRNKALDQQHFALLK